MLQMMSSLNVGQKYAINFFTETENENSCVGHSAVVKYLTVQSRSETGRNNFSLNTSDVILSQIC